MKRATLTKWTLRSLAAIILITVIVVLWVNHQLKIGRGSFTPLVEADAFVKPMPDFLIKNVNLLSPDCAQFIANQQVVVKNGMITEIGQDSIFEEGMEVIDGSGKFLIPGLVDSHVHLRNSKNDLLLYLANGVTYVREMSGNTTHLAWKKEITEGAIGPRMYIASEKVPSKSGVAALFEEWTRTRIHYASERAAEKKIKQLKMQGFDAVKMSSFMNTKMYDATIKEAERQTIPVIGHIPYDVGLEKIYSSGQTELAHVEEITKALIEEFGGLNSTNAEAYLEFARNNCDKIAEQIKKNKIAVSTTIWLIESLPQQSVALSTIVKEVKLDYANPVFVEGTKLSKGWLPENNGYEASKAIRNDEVQRKNTVTYWNAYVEAIHIMNAALAKHDVLIMAGTDANGALTVPGFSLHDELISMSASGMTNAQVLHAATVAPGAWMKSNTGKIQTGYRADLVLLSQNPLEAIQHTNSVEAVFFGKNYLSREAIQSMLAAILTANEKNRNTDITAYMN